MSPSSRRELENPWLRASVGMYVGSMALPSLGDVGLFGNEDKLVWGWQMLLIGGAALLDGIPAWAWLANLLHPVSLIALVRAGRPRDVGPPRRPRRGSTARFVAMFSSVGAALLAGTWLVDMVREDEFTDIQIGYYVWLSAMVIAVVACLRAPATPEPES